MDVKGLAAMVTGAGQGMGRAFAFELARAGADVAIGDVNEKTLADTAQEIGRETGRKVYRQVVDISRQDQVRDFVRNAERDLGKVDVLVNTAAIHPLHPIEEITEEEWDKVLAVNLKGMFFLCQAVIPGMRQRKFGRIINISSEAGKNGGTIAGLHYAATKGAVLSFTRNLAKQVGADGITVNAVAPGRIATAMAKQVSPEENQVFIDKSVIKRLGDPEDVAYAVLYLASRRASFVTGETMMVNGGTLMD